MKFENTEVWGFEHAFRGMRQPLQSHGKSDSLLCWHKTTDEDCRQCPLYNDEEQCRKTIKFQQKTKIPFYIIGKNDLELAQKLIKAGSEHRKFMRQIFVATDITAPLFFFKELDTYIGTVANSTSTMHKLSSTPITKECFEMDDFEDVSDIDTFGFVSDWWDNNIYYLEELRQNYNRTKDKRYWKELIRLLPEPWLQTRTVTMNYENLLNMYHQRCAKPHKLTEWSVKFKEWVESLPYARELIIGE